MKEKGKELRRKRNESPKEGRSKDKKKGIKNKEKGRKE